MLKGLQNFFTLELSLPHKHCYLQNPELAWLHLVSDLLIALAFYSILVALIYFVYQRPDLPFNWILLLFGIFMIASGTTYIMEVWILWYPTYWLSGLLKATTAIVSTYTAIELVPLVPKILALPSPAQMEATNQELQKQIAEREQAQSALQKANEELEIRVEERTMKLRQKSEQLQVEVSDRLRAEDALRESEERLNAVLDNSTALISVKDTQGRYILINHWYETLFHLEREQVKGKTDYDLFPQELADEYQAHDRRVLEANTAMEWEEVTLQDDGLHTYISIKFPLYDTAGVAYAVCSISTDISERKQAEEALRKSLGTNRALLNAIPDLMLRIKRDGTFINYKAAKGNNQLVPRRDILGKKLFEVLPLDVAELAMKCLKQALKTGDVQIFEYQLLVHQKRLDFEARIVVSAEDEVMAIVRDITERKRVEEDIRHALEKQKELSELKSRFVSMTSHEFRTPLTTILSSAELIEKYSHKLTEEKKLQHLHRIQAAVKQMTQLLNDVLLIGKAEANNLHSKPALLNLAQFCHDLVEELQSSLSSNHTIIFCHQGELKEVWMDEKLLLSILSNLLSNAIKYSPQGGKVRFNLIRQQEEAIFQIQDWGIGIPAAEQAKLFDSFHRASNVGTISGTGLGLAIVKKSVDLHGGKIVVKSEVGVGTTFEVALPLNKQV